MSVASFQTIFAELDHHFDDSAHEPVSVVAAGGDDPTVLQALAHAVQRGWISAIVTGEEQPIRNAAEQANLDSQSFTIVDSHSAATVAVETIRSGRAKILMKGQVSTPDLMRAVLDRNNGLRTEQTICQVVLIELTSRNRRFLLADTGVCIAPDVEQKVEIMTSAVQVARKLGIEKPRVALMAATEKPSSAMPETVEAEEITKRFQSASDSVSSVELGDCLVQGPLSFDLAFADTAGDSKKVAGPVIGHADVLIFPNLVSANLTVKAIMYTADCEFGGILCGVRCPVVFMSRSDSTETRIRSLALALKTLI